MLIYFPDWKDVAGPPIPESAKDTTEGARSVHQASWPVVSYSPHYRYD